MLFRLGILIAAVAFYRRSQRRDRKKTSAKALPPALLYASQQCASEYSAGKVAVTVVIENGECADLIPLPTRERYLECLVRPAADYYLRAFSQVIPDPSYIGTGTVRTMQGDLASEAVADYVLRIATADDGQPLMQKCPFPNAATLADNTELPVSAAARAFYLDVLAEVSRVMDAVNASGGV